MGKSSPAGANLWRAQTLRQRWESYRDQLDKCRKTPSENSVHELRVATRRLMSQCVLLDCVVPSRQHQKVRRILKAQLKSLSDLRDHHVQQTFIRQQSGRFPELSALRQHLKRQERKLIREAARQIKRFNGRKLRKWIGRLLEELASDLGSLKHAKLTAQALQRAGEAFAATVERRRSIDFTDLATIHRTRVAFKKFRYLVESLPPEITGFTKRDLRYLAYYQRRMGKVQDLQVVEQCLTDFTQRNEDRRTPLAQFSAYLRGRRTRALRGYAMSADELYSFWPAPALSTTPDSPTRLTWHRTAKSPTS